MMLKLTPISKPATATRGLSRHTYMSEVAACAAAFLRHLEVSAKVMVAVCLVAFIGCRQKMDVQPKYLPLEKSTFFKDGRASRPLVEGTVARGQLQAGNPLYTGLKNPPEDEPVATDSSAGANAIESPIRHPFNPDNLSLYVDRLPVPVTAELLDRGQQRYTIFCSVCHDARGTGHGVVVRRGFSPPPSYHIDRLRDAPVGYIFEIVTHGYGSMPSHAEQIPPRDRWAIAAYVKTLQLSQRVSLADLPPDDQEVIRSSLSGSETP
jgi:mono/diheme cytochrome c family protein